MNHRPEIGNAVEVTFPDGSELLGDLRLMAISGECAKVERPMLGVLSYRWVPLECVRVADPKRSKKRGKRNG